MSDLLSVPVQPAPRRAGVGRRGWTDAAMRIGVVLPISVAALVATTIPASGQTRPTGPDPVSGRSITLEQIIPADVLARVELLRDEIELIRFEMGLPRARSAELNVTAVTPREVMFQAFTLYLKAKQLLFEVTGEQEPNGLLHQPGEVRPLHVWRVVGLAFTRTRLVKRELGIDTQAVEKLQDSTKTPTDVFLAILAANRQFDLLLKQRLSTSDVFHQVRQASHYAARLLGQFPGATVMPPTPAFERGKRPVDVYNRLVECYALLHGIAERSGIQTLTLRVSKLNAAIDDPAQVAPSEVYNIAVLLVSELAHLHRALNYFDVPTPALELGFKIPAAVYQQSGVLLAQLADLEPRIDANPDWLHSANRDGAIGHPEGRKAANSVRQGITAGAAQ